MTNNCNPWGDCTLRLLLILRQRSYCTSYNNPCYKYKRHHAYLPWKTYTGKKLSKLHSLAVQNEQWRGMKGSEHGPDHEIDKAHAITLTAATGIVSNAIPERPPRSHHKPPHNPVPSQMRPCNCKYRILWKYIHTQVGIGTGNTLIPFNVHLVRIHTSQVLLPTKGGGVCAFDTCIIWLCW